MSKYNGNFERIIDGYTNNEPISEFPYNEDKNVFTKDNFLLQISK